MPTTSTFGRHRQVKVIFGYIASWRPACLKTKRTRTHAKATACLLLWKQVRWELGVPSGPPTAGSMSTRLESPQFWVPASHRLPWLLTESPAPAGWEASPVNAWLGGFVSVGQRWPCYYAAGEDSGFLCRCFCLLLPSSSCHPGLPHSPSPSVASPVRILTNPVLA